MFKTPLMVSKVIGRALFAFDTPCKEMVCSLHSVTTGSRDRANVPLIIIIIIISKGRCKPGGEYTPA